MKIWKVYGGEGEGHRMMEIKGGVFKILETFKDFREGHETLLAMNIPVIMKIHHG